MKTKRIYLYMMATMATLVLACNKNADTDWPDFDYTSVYFSYQAVGRTITFGKEELIDNALDNERKVEIKAALGGTRDNKANVSIGYAVDESLLQNKYFDDAYGGGKMVLLPSTHYNFLSDQMKIPAGSILNGVQVQFTDAFFADPDAIKSHYVIPLKMVSVQNADSILSNKNYVLYGVKFVNKWHGNYLRRGKDNVTYADASTATVVRHAQYRKDDELRKLSTVSLQAINFPITYKDKTGTNVQCTLRLTFDNSGNCTVTSATAGVTASGSGSFKENGETMDGKQKDGLYLNYQVSAPGINSVTTLDTLIIRDRAVSAEFQPAVTK
ncbi:DUF5627 domain-containing protein [Niabella yanshanensis]|uniref:DUF5627 domain-containing protein n=1 Tax=Niabella yanshanensis TaxID=577386 RepID=A0ABZ0W651_9BACT|nr:DUF5627 domain-containing protein [Niabella yanshanensis]WQD38722.1 DUF5627 domain-containing protein [Niabella yanshanensis]